MPNTVTKKLPCRLQLPEIAAKAKQQAMNDVERRRLEAEMGETSKSYKKKIGSLDEANRELAIAVATGIEERLIECQWVTNERTLEMMLVRGDTGEIIDQRGMTVEERQAELKFAETAKDVADAPAPAPREQLALPPGLDGDDDEAPPPMLEQGFPEEPEDADVVDDDLGGGGVDDGMGETCPTCGRGANLEDILDGRCAICRAQERQKKPTAQNKPTETSDKPPKKARGAKK